MGIRHDVDWVRGTSRGVNERFGGSDYERTKLMVRAAARSVYSVDALVASYALANPEPDLDLRVVTRQATALLATPAEHDVSTLLDPHRHTFEWYQVAAGTWNGNDAVWEHIASSGAFDVADETPTGLLQLAQRWGTERLRELTSDGREYLALLGMYGASEGLLADPTSNIFLNLGTEHLWRRVTGVGGQDQLFDNSHSRIGVGSSNTAAARTQTDLQGASKTYDVMESGFPTVTAGDASGGAKTAYKTVYGSSEANHAHLEWVVDNKASGTPGTKVMNRKVQNFGDKASGSTWTYTFELQIN